MKKLLLILFGAVLLPTLVLASYKAGFNSAVSDNPEQKTTHLNSKTLEALSQSWRIDSGLPTYNTGNQDLCAVAEIRLEQIQSEFNHDSFNNNVDKLYDISNASGMGENLMMGFDNTETAFNSLLVSPTHLDNLKDIRFNSICVRCQDSYCVQMFGAY